MINIFYNERIKRFFGASDEVEKGMKKNKLKVKGNKEEITML